MKVGFVSAILPEFGFEELADYAANCGYVIKRNSYFII
jgi:hypothetical protein